MAWSFYDQNGKVLQGVLAVSIDTTELAADAVTGAKIADDAIDSEHYVNGSIDNAHLADDAVDSDEIAAGAIDLAHMSVNSIDSDQYVDRSIDTVHIGLNQVTLAEMAGITRGSIIYGDSSGDPTALALGASGLALKSDGTDLVYGSAGVSLGLVIALGG